MGLHVRWPRKGTRSAWGTPPSPCLSPGAPPSPSSSPAKKEGGSSPVSGKDMDVPTSKTQLTPLSKEGDVKDMILRDRETSNIETLPSDSPKEEPRPPR